MPLPKAPTKPATLLDMSTAPKARPRAARSSAKPSEPTNLSAEVTGTGPYGINVTFGAPTSPGGLPVVFYEYTTDNGANWRRFTNPNQGPAAGIALPGPSGGGSGFSDGIYQVAVRAVNALGSTATTPSSITIPPTP